MILSILVAARGIEFDLSISFGNILTIISFIVGGIYFVASIQRRLDIQAVTIKDLEEDITQISAETQNDVKNLGQVIVLQSRHDERITALQLTVVGQGQRLDHTVERMNTYLDARVKASDE